VPHAIEDDLRALWDDAPAPAAAFLTSLRRSLTQPARTAPARRRRLPTGRFLGFAAAFVLLGAAAYAATGSPFYSTATSDALVSNTYSITGPTAASLGSFPAAVTCNQNGNHASCIASDPTAAGAYILTARAGSPDVTPDAIHASPLRGNQTTWMFVDGGSKIVVDDKIAPIIACPTAATDGQLACSPILAGAIYPEGTPIYENAVKN
jgi:hypothetical protein